MRTLNTILAPFLLVCVIQTVSIAQSTNISESLKKHFNETVQAVQETENTEVKRVILNESFDKMIATIDRIESLSSITEEESARLKSYAFDLTEKKNELNGLKGFDAVRDENLDDFSNFSQDFIEQADRTVTIGITTALLILIILLLL